MTACVPLKIAMVSLDKRNDCPRILTRPLLRTRTETPSAYGSGALLFRCILMLPPCRTDVKLGAYLRRLGAVHLKLRAGLVIRFWPLGRVLTKRKSRIGKTFTMSLHRWLRSADPPTNRSLPVPRLGKPEGPLVCGCTRLRLGPMLGPCRLGSSKR